jgi:hypothetical protein
LRPRHGGTGALFGGAAERAPRVAAREPDDSGNAEGERERVVSSDGLADCAAELSQVQGGECAMQQG